MGSSFDGKPEFGERSMSFAENTLNKSSNSRNMEQIKAKSFVQTKPFDDL